MERSLLLKAQHLAGVLNTIADNESRVMKDWADWKLCPAVFHQINRRLGLLEVDLFASRLTHQLQTYVSWRPDPMAMATDAFTLDWAALRAYANPPWNLIGRVLAQTRRQQTELVLVAPVWKEQGWYPVLLEMLVKIPLLIPQRGNLITQPHTGTASQRWCPNWPCGLSPAALQGLPGFRGSYENAPGAMETEVLQDLRLLIREVGQLVW